MKYLNLLTFLFLAPYVAHADSFPALTSYLTSEIARGHQMMADSESEPPTGNDAFILRRLLVRVQASVGIRVPWIATFEIVPEVELLWDKRYPAGWEHYKR